MRTEMMKMPTLARKAFDLEIKDVEESGLFKGYGSVFDVVDTWHDVIVKGAFEKSLAKKTPVMLWQHNSEEPIGIYTSVSEDDIGLNLEGRLLIDGVARAREAHALLKHKAIRGLSIGYVPLKYEWDTRDGTRVRLLKEIDLWEVSLVTFPANAKALVGDVKSDEMSIRDAEELLRDAGFSRSEAKAIIAACKSSAERDAGEDEANKMVKDAEMLELRKELERAQMKASALELILKMRGA